MATYSNNTTLKVSGAIAAAGYNGTLFSCPANSYAIINVHKEFLNQAGTMELAVGGVRVAYEDQNYGINGCTTATPFQNMTIYVGPSQSVVATNSKVSGLNYQWILSGVYFINTP